MKRFLIRRGAAGAQLILLAALFASFRNSSDTNSDPPSMELMGLQERAPFCPGPSLAQTVSRASSLAGWKIVGEKHVWNVWPWLGTALLHLSVLSSE